ncbi:MAG: sigma-70 family RNA polymerase sigma factor [Rhodopirellula sp. JB053]|uniref:sigma-70 family RNA polymerase sigma factor n=1 Tax=Rhodopirellula sp. JB044 TaxID=3342844 RepID=UPI00370CB6BD
MVEIGDSPRAAESDRTLEFIRLLGNEERRLYAYILALVPRWSDADDIAQQTRIRLWQQFDQYDPSRDFGAWARTIAHYLVLAHRKKSEREGSRMTHEFVEAVAEQVTQNIDEVEVRQRNLLICMQKLSDGHRELLKRYYSGLEDRRDIAADVGRSFDSVRQTVRRLRLSLVRCVDGLAMAEASGE